MLNYITKRRFNMVDSVGIVAFSDLLPSHGWLIAIATLFGFILVSGAVEAFAGR